MPGATDNKLPRISTWIIINGGLYPWGFISGRFISWGLITGIGKARRNIPVLIKIRLACSGLSLKASERSNKSTSFQYILNRSEGVCTPGEAYNSDVLYFTGGWVCN